MKTIAIRWHSRAGNGAVTASAALAEILGTRDRFVQSFPDFGAEKRGAPVVVFNRISDEPIGLTAHPTAVDAVLLLDASLLSSGELSTEDLLAGLSDDGVLLINTPQTQTAIEKRHRGKTILVDANAISISEIGRAIPNVPMLGALVSALSLAPIDEFSTALQTILASSGLPEKIVAGNVRAFSRGAGEFRASFCHPDSANGGKGIPNARSDTF